MKEIRDRGKKRNIKENVKRKKEGKTRDYGQTKEIKRKINKRKRKKEKHKSKR